VQAHYTDARAIRHPARQFEYSAHERKGRRRTALYTSRVWVGGAQIGTM